MPNTFTDALMRISASLVTLTAAGLSLAWAADWPAFRGPNSGGVGTDVNLPVEMGPAKNMVWKTPLPPGHSSPVLSGDSIFVTAFDGPKLLVISLDRKSGAIKWRREAPRERKQELHAKNSPASPSVATDGKNVYAFFTDFGLISYGWDGNERWKLPLGPFNNPFGMGASPLLVKDRIIMSCDSETGSFLLAVNKDSGKVLWRVERPDVGRGFSTPILYDPPGGPTQALLPGSFQLISFDVSNGKPVWWASGLTWQLKPTPVMDDKRVYVLGWAGGSDEGNQEEVMPWEEAVSKLDKDGDKLLAKDEILDRNLRNSFGECDLDKDGKIGARDWEMYRRKRRSLNSITAFRLGGKGDVSDTHVAWRYTKSLPNAPSPLLYQGIVYLQKEGGILTALDAESGKVLKQGRMAGALDQYFASPVAADGKIYMVSESGHLVVVKAGADWEVLAVNDLDEPCYATPALVDGRVYVRTAGHLYAFGAQ